MAPRVKGTPIPVPTQSVPTISASSWAQGQVATCNPGVWYNAPTIAYQWIRGASTNVGSNSPNYTLVAGDVGSTIKCRVTATNVLGTVTQESAVSPTVV